MQDKKLKILMLTEDYEPIYGGISSVVKNSSVALSKFADVTIGTIMPPQKLQSKINDPSCLKVYRCSGKYNKVTTNMSVNLKDKIFRSQIEQQHYDIIHCHFPMGLYKYGLKLGKKQNVPVVITAHSIFYPDFKSVVKFGWVAKLGIRIVLKRYNKSSKTLAVTPYAKNYLTGFGLKNSVVLNNAVLMDEFEPINTQFANLVRQNYCLEPNDFVIASISRLAPMKNLLFSVRAFAELHNKYPQAKYLIVGDGQEYNALKNLIAKLNLQDCCFLLGALTDKTKLGAIYSIADIVSFMSKGDSCGLIQYEAGYFAKPTIALANTAVADCITDMQNGIVINGEQNSLKVCKKPDKTAIQNFVNKVGYLIENREDCKTLGQNAKEQVYRTYDDNYAQEVLTLYKNIINEYNSRKK